MQEEIRIDKIIPCLPAQHGFLVDSEAGSSDVYKQQITISISPSAGLNSDIVEANIRKIQKECDMLRTVFDWSTGKEMQIVLSGILPRISFVSGDIDKLKKAAADELVELDTITDEPPVRFLITMVGNQLYLTITYHHILFDGPSVTLLLDSILSPTGEYPAKDSTGNYLRWLSANINDQDRQFWKHVLSTLPNEDVDVFGDSRNDSSEHTETRLLSRHASSALLGLAKKYKVSVATLMQAICTEWLVGYFNKPLLYGSVLSTREFEINDNHLGPFINTVPVQVSPGTTSDLRVTAKSIQEQALSMSRAKHVPLRDIAESIPSHSLFFDIITTITTTPVQDKQGLYEVVWTHENTGFPLSIDINVAQPVSFSFTTILDQRDFDITEAVKSFEEYCLKRILGNEQFIHVEPHAPFRAREKTRQRSIAVNLLAEKVAQALDIEVGAVDFQKSFLLNGGDSILALKLKNKLSSSGFKVAVSEIIRKDSLVELADEVIFDDADEPAGDRSPKGPLYVPSSISYILEAYRLGYEKDYHEQAAFCMDGSLDVDVFRKAVYELSKETASLNLSYGLQGKLTLAHDESHRAEFHFIRNESESFDSFTNDVSGSDLEKPFVPDSGALLRAYVSTSDNGWYLLLSFSALVTDGWSFSTLLERLFVLYSSLLNNAQTKTRHDNLLTAFPLMKTVAVANGIPQKDPHHGKTVSRTFTLSREESDLIQKKAGARRVTPSQYFEKAVISLTKHLDATKVFVYESGRDIDVDASATIGAFSYLRQIDTQVSDSETSSGMYYVYENYPRESEERLREDKIAEFKERGVWRRPLLPPPTALGVVIDIVDEAYSIDILVRSRSEKETGEINKKSYKIFELLRKELSNE